MRDLLPKIKQKQKQITQNIFRGNQWDEIVVLGRLTENDIIVREVADNIQ